MESQPRSYEPYRDVPAAPFRWRLGLRPLDLANWIEVDDRYEAEIAHKNNILAEHHSTAFNVRPDIEPESREVLDSLLAHLATLDSERFGDLDVDDALHPLDAAGKLVQEDLILMVERDGKLVCGGGSVCFPNRWDLLSKVGLSMAEIHAPVSMLNESLEAPIDGFLARLTPERSFWRLGWGVLDTDELYQATDGTAPVSPTGLAYGDHVLRVERETLRRFPQTGCILFTIKTYLTPLSELTSGGGAAELAEAIDALPDDVAEYKQLDAVGRDLVAYLATTRSQ